MKAYAGKILVADLTKGKTSSIDTDSALAAKFLGGGGYACAMLYGLMTAPPDPLGPDNPLLFMTGPLTGTMAPCSGRHVVCARSPLTGFWGESNSGGHFGANLKFSGFDGILIKGRAKKPTLLFIDDGSPSLIPGEHVWGMTTDAAQDRIKRDLGRVQVACIGPAGENKVRFASIMNDERSAARCGLGAVMGSKMLKAIAVRGKNEVQLADPVGFKAMAQKSSRTLGELMAPLRESGTALYVDIGMEFNDMPIRYFQETSFDISSLNAKAMASILTGRIACHSCPIGCGRRISIPEMGLENVAGPEYQTIAAFGTNVMNADIKQVARMNRLCNQLGMDTVSCGSTLALAMHLRETGVLDIDLDWGDTEKMADMIQAIAAREGQGNLLAEGSKRLGDSVGASDQVIHVKGMEVPNHDPRAFSGMATIYSIAARGATHLEGDMYSVDMGADVRELGINSGDRLDNEGKGAIAARAQDYRAFFDLLVMCHFAILPLQTVVDLLRMATGCNMNLNDMLTFGARSVTMKRLFNLKCGLKPEDDTLPTELLKPLPESATDDFVPDIQMQLRDYYQYRKWDEKTGRPRIESLKGLGLES
jgi:aldehyde:ferredoxin oxidoreductase